MQVLELQRIGLPLQLQQVLQQVSQAGQQAQAEMKVVRKLLEQLLQWKVQQNLWLWLLLPPSQPSFLPVDASNFNLRWQIKSGKFMLSTVCTAKWKTILHAKDANSP